MKNKLFYLLFFLLFINLFILTACQERNGATLVSNEKKMTVYTSFYPMYDFAKKIGGEKIIIVNLVPPGIEPHDWEPSAKDVAGISKADVFLYNGGGMEGWLEKIKPSLGKKVHLVETSKGIIYLANKEQDEDLPYDPHTWLNPKNAAKQMYAIKNAFQESDPQNKAYYQTNYEKNLLQLRKLDEEYANSLSKCEKKEILVSHQAFSYLCSAYGLKQIAIEGLLADSEPSPARMAEITELAKKSNIKYIFFEELISPKVAQAIAKQVGAKTEMLNPLEGLSQKEISAGKEYFSVMRDNLKKLKKALE